MISMVHLFKILSDETRLRIMALLIQEPLCVCELSGILNLSQPKVSKHLSKLKDLNLVSDQRVGKYMMYSLTLDSDFSKDILDVIVNHKEAMVDLITDGERLKLKNEFLDRCQITNL